MGNLHVHGVGAVGKVEATSLTGAVGAEAKLAVGASGLGHALVGVFVLVVEVLLNDVVSLHVDLLVGVVLAVVNLVHAAALLDEKGKLVQVLGTLVTRLLVEVANLENVLETVEGNLDDLVVGADQEVAQRLDAALGNEVSDLFRLLQSTRGGVADGPAGLLAGLEITVLEEVDQRGDDVGINDGLDLGRVAGGDVGNGPASLLADAVLGGAQEREQAGEGAAVDDDLGLHVVTGDNVADGAESRGLDRGGGVEEELDESAGDTSFNNSLDLLVRAVRQVRDGPAGVDEDFVVERVDELGENGQRRGNLFLG